MSQKTSSLAMPEISRLIAKYLYFMTFIKSSSPETLRAYRLDLTQAFQLSRTHPDLDPSQWEATAPRFADIHLSEDALLGLCREALSRWVSLSASSRNRKAACLKSFLNWLHEQGLTERELALQIHSPRIPQRLPHYLSVDETLALIQTLKTNLEQAHTETENGAILRDFALILLLYGGGLRVSEACLLKWDQISLKKNTIRIVGKGQKERLVVVPAMVIGVLENLKSQKGTYIFGDSPLSTRVAYNIVRRWGNAAGLLKPLHPHALRHSYATHLLSSGANLRTLQDLLGHTTLQATQRYTHVGIDQLARTLESFHPLAKPTKD